MGGRGRCCVESYRRAWPASRCRRWRRPYSDFARWQDKAIAGDRLAALTAYWAAQLEGLPPLLELPIEFPRPSLQTYRGQWVSVGAAAFPGWRTARPGPQSRATMFMTLLAGWTCLLGRYSGSSDICVGTPTGGPRQGGVRELDRLVHEYARAANAIGRRTAFHEVIERVRDTCLGAWDHDLPFEYLKQALPPERSLTHSPYFQVYFQLRNFPRAAVSPVAPVTEVEAQSRCGDHRLEPGDHRDPIGAGVAGWHTTPRSLPTASPAPC